MKRKPVYITVGDEHGNIIKPFPITEADADWIKVARIKRKADQVCKETVDKLKEMSHRKFYSENEGFFDFSLYQSFISG